MPIFSACACGISGYIGSDKYPIVEINESNISDILENYCNAKKSDIVDEMERNLEIVRENFTEKPYMKYFQKEILETEKVSKDRCNFLTPDFSLF